jgi:predicted TIM-barrel fold metal-dependent hydrolase
MIVDSLAFLGESLFGADLAAGELLRRMDELDVATTVVCPARPRGYALPPANDAVAAAVADAGGRLVGLARVDPLLGADAEAEAERALGELGLRGLFLHPWEETFRLTDPRVPSVVEVARRHGVPVVVAAGYPWLSEALQLGALAGRFPDVTFVATNGLQLNISGLGQTDAELALEDNENLLLLTSGVYREDFLEGVVRRFGARRLLYASAQPTFDPRLEIRRAQWADFGDGAAAILGGNAAAVFGL